MRAVIFIVLSASVVISPSHVPFKSGNNDLSNRLTSFHIGRDVKPVLNITKTIKLTHGAILIIRIIGIFSSQMF